MMEETYPSQQTTTVKTSATTVNTTIRFDPFYIRTLPGWLKCAEIVFNLLGFICIECSGVFAYHSRGGFFNFVAMTGFWVTGLLLAFYLFHIIEKFYRIPWLKFELGYCATWTVFYLIASCLAVTMSQSEAYIAAGFFGFCGMVTYGFDAFLKYKALGTGELAQGERVVSKQTSTVTSPAY